MSYELREKIEEQLKAFFNEIYDGHLFDVADTLVEVLGLTVEHGAAFNEHDIHGGLTLKEAESMTIWNPGMYLVERVIGDWERS